MEPRSGPIGDFVWDDANRNGIQDPGETGVAGFPVTLMTGADTDGNTISLATTTDADWKYAFTDFQSGDYTVTFSPAGLAGNQHFTLQENRVLTRRWILIGMLRPGRPVWSPCLRLLEIHKDRTIVAEYWTLLPDKAELQARIAAIYHDAQERIARGQLARFDGEQEQIATKTALLGVPRHE